MHQNLFEKISASWKLNGPASLSSIQSVEEELKISFPEDYKDFLLWSNGGESLRNEISLSLWPVVFIPTSNRDYSVFKYLGNKIIGFGTDGGGILYAFDFNLNIPSIVSCPLGDLDPNEIKQVSSSFEKFISTVFQDGI